MIARAVSCSCVLGPPCASGCEIAPWCVLLRGLANYLTRAMRIYDMYNEALTTGMVFFLRLHSVMANGQSFGSDCPLPIEGACASMGTKAETRGVKSH